ncbi:hypothetical protein H7849_07760 [Alloacidobacterium dinghuense]|uniref:Uncharacterized protein n=1 Tax=Alloacidobacterium dinghuense TaxID=2763107 RepID=A0A7G8BMN4_9BACT|nr:hypothetical protein [Alloacidobacterium dinghuense]QNI33804.1 hypothetical protein H7849_07760 [Alloacidobacterium dinghuense]
MIVTQAIPQPVAERYLTALKGLVSTVRSALGTAGSAPQSSGWRKKMLPLLESRLAESKTALAHHAIGDQEPLISIALKSRSLARDMDGYSLGFAGEALATQFEDRRRLVVFAAWQVCESAGVV